MNQLVRIWNSLTMAQRISLAAAPVVIFALSMALLHWKREGDFRTLYSSLAPEDAVAVTQKIREAGIEFRLDETGSAVSVPSAKLAEVRLALAGAGLPHTGRIGFELFDKTNLGASDFAEQVNYRRALEGELERTVGTLSEVAQARIHLTFAKESVFLDSRQPAKATAVLKLRRENRLSQTNVVAIANLIASAVDGLAPESVAIVDSSGRLLNRPRNGEDNEARAAEANFDYRRQLESELLSKINQSLEPLLGAGKFRAGLNVECDFTTSEESEETYDSSKSALTQSQSTEESNSIAGSAGTPGTASNLPRSPERQTANASGIFRRTESMSYLPGKSVRHTVAPKGTIRRLSAAVLVDHGTRWTGSGTKARRTLIAPSPEVLKAVREVVASVTGYNEQRGDQITVEALPFESTLNAEPPMTAQQSPVQKLPFDYRQPLLLGIAAGSILLFGAMLFMIMRRKPAPAAATAQAELAGASATQQEKVSSGTAEHSFEQQIADNGAEQRQIEADVISRIKLPANTRKTEVLMKHIREGVQKDPVSAANVLRTWVAEGEAKRTV